MNIPRHTERRRHATRGGLLLQLLRRAFGMTQKELGALLGVSHESVSRWESGGYTPHASFRRHLAAILSAPELDADWGPRTVVVTLETQRAMLTFVRAALHRARIVFTEEELDAVPFAVIWPYRRPTDDARGAADESATTPRA